MSPNIKPVFVYIKENKIEAKQKLKPKRKNKLKKKYLEINIFCLFLILL